MFRRSLQLVVGCVMLVLALTLGYVLLGLSGPREQVINAGLDFQKGRYAACVRLLDIVESSLGPNADPDLRRDLLALRWQAHNETGNWSLALRDIRQLRALGGQSKELARSEIRLSIQAGDPEAALALADSYLDKTPDDGEVLGLAGEACQVRYQPAVAELLTQLRNGLDPATSDRAIRALRSWLFRDPNDPLSELGYEHFVEVLRESRRDLLGSATDRARLEEIAGLIRRSQTFFKRALESADAPISAFRGVTFALQEAVRPDDRQWLGELYLHRFHHLETVEAAIDLVDLHFAHERWRSVVSVADQFLPPGTWASRIEDQSLDSRVREVWLAKMRALEHLGDLKAINAFADEVKAVQADGRIQLDPEANWILAIEARANKRIGDCMKLLQVYERALAESTPTTRVVEHRIDVLEERVQIGKAQNWGPQFFESTNGMLARLDPNNTRRFLDQTYFHIDAKDPASALIDVRNAARIDAQNELVLRAQAMVRNEQLRPTGSDAASIFNRCVQLGQTLPTDAPDEMLPLIAEEALAHKRPDIARNCAALATRKFPWAKWPRHLLVEANVSLNDAIEAVRTAEEFVVFHPKDEQSLIDLRRARILAGVSHDDLIRDLLLSGRRDGIIAADLLRRAAGDDDLQLAQHLATTVEKEFRDEPEALLAVADVYEKLGRLKDARRILGDVSGSTIATDPNSFRRSFQRFVVLSARTGTPREELATLVGQCVGIDAGDTAQLTSLAVDLRDAGHVDLAYIALTPVLTEDSHRNARSGMHFLLAGRLALALGLHEPAKRHFTAALSFPDGADASRELTLLQLADGEDVAARNSFWEAEIRDLVAASLAARFEQTAAAKGWVRRRLESAPADLSALALAAVLEIDRGVPNPATTLARAHRAELLDVLTFLDATGFEKVATERMAALLADGREDPIARTLQAHLLARQGASERALQILQSVIRDMPLLVSAYDEAARIIESSGVDVIHTSTVQSDFVRPELLASGLGTPRMIDLATRSMVNSLLMQIGNHADRIDELAGVWITSAASGSVGLQQVDLLISVGRFDLALRLAEVVESHVPAEQRDRFLLTYFFIADALLAKNPDVDLEDRMTNRAERIIREEGPTGPAVNFLIDRDVAHKGPLSSATEPIRVRRIGGMLDAYFKERRAEIGRPRTFGLLRCLERLAELRGRSAALVVLDERLRALPTRIDLWRLRADWLVAEGDFASALESLRWTFDYLPHHEAALHAVNLAARFGEITPADLAAFERVKEEPQLAASTEAKVTEAILAIRAGDYAKATSLLDDDTRDADGAADYYRGLAALEQGKLEAAKASLERLLSAHADNSLASMAGHFVAQLAQALSAPSSPANR
ncbi:MAG: hypothetical protein U1F36_07740 [Planctomycetota bacterium]